LARAESPAGYVFDVAIEHVAGSLAEVVPDVGSSIAFIWEEAKVVPHAKPVGGESRESGRIGGAADDQEWQAAGVHCAARAVEADRRRPVRHGSANAASAKPNNETSARLTRGAWAIEARDGRLLLGRAERSRM
jgi:hypothetical protein